MLISCAVEIDDPLGWVFLTQGDAGTVLTYLSAASRTAPKNPDIQYHLAVVLNRLGWTADAQETLETLLGSGVTFSDRPADHNHRIARDRHPKPPPENMSVFFT